MKGSLIFRTAILALVIIFGGATTTVLAANASQPGDFLYPLDLGMEQLQQSLALDSARQVELKLDTAQERLDEARLLVASGDYTDAQTAVDKFDVLMDEIASTAVSSPGSTMAVSPSLDAHFGDEIPAGGEQPEDEGETSDYCLDGATAEHPVGAKLALEYGVDYDEIMGWYCQGYGFGEIKLAYSLSAQNPDYKPEDLFGMRAQGLGWGEIVQIVTGTTGEDDGNENENGNLNENENGNENGNANANENGNGNENGNANGNANANANANDAKNDSARCGTDGTSTSQHPEGQKLALEYGVPYEEIMSWFCKGYGFGEIKLAYGIANAKTVPVAEVFALRASGMGWGQIMKHYDLTGNPNNNGQGGKPEDGSGNGPENGSGGGSDRGHGNGKPSDKPGGKPEGKPGGGKP